MAVRAFSHVGTRVLWIVGLPAFWTLVASYQFTWDPTEYHTSTFVGGVLKAYFFGAVTAVGIFLGGVLTLAAIAYVACALADWLKEGHELDARGRRRRPQDKSRSATFRDLCASSRANLLKPSTLGGCKFWQADNAVCDICAATCAVMNVINTCGRQIESRVGFDAWVSVRDALDLAVIPRSMLQCAHADTTAALDEVGWPVRAAAFHDAEGLGFMHGFNTLYDVLSLVQRSMREG